jgi:hypothetical protein
MTNSDLVALVDDEDYERLIVYRWYAVEGKRGNFYAQRRVRGNSDRPAYAREIQRDVLDPDMTASRAMIASYRNHNTMDNQRHNLRWLDHRGSVLNRRLFKTNTSGYRGVSFDDMSRRVRQWRACVRSMGVRYISYHLTAEDAARAYNEMARLHHGEHVQLNIISDSKPS